MGLISNLAMLWKNREKIKIVSTEINQVKGAYVKSGWKTSEFWVTVLSVATTLSETFKGNLDPKWGAVVSAALALGYAVVRGFTKATATGTTETTTEKK